MTDGESPVLSRVTTKLSEVWTAVESLARESGALRVGATVLRDEHVGAFESWLARGHAASMEYLQGSLDIRRDPQKRYPWASSAIVMTFPYSPERPRDDSIAAHTARYALGDDYHDVLDRRLRRLEETLTSIDPSVRTWRYVDTGPLSDRSLAAQAGLGWIGRNAMLIDEGNGSYFFIAVLLTSLENDIRAETVADRCGTCTSCVDACPTHTILPDRTVDSNGCISWATIEHRGTLSDWMKSSLEGNVFGCDICQEVCPWNSKAPEGLPEFAARESLLSTPVGALLHLSQTDFSSLFRRSAVKRAKRSGMIRNVVAAVGGEPASGSEDDSGIADAIAWRGSSQR